MNFPKTSRVTTLLGTASLLAMAQAEQVYPAEVVAQADEIPETVLITGSLIRGTAAVGVPVVNLSPQDFAMTGAITASDLFRTIPQFNVNPGPVSTQGNNRQRGVRVNLRQLDTTDALRSLMMVDGLRYPPQSEELSTIDPSILPTSAIERIDLLLDGASATYGSDAIGGVINIILKRNFDGAMVEAGFQGGKGGHAEYLASGTWGRTWDGGQVTLSYSWIDASPAHGNVFSKLTLDHRPWGLDDRRPIGSSTPGTISTGNQVGLSMPDPNNPGSQIANPLYPGNLGTNCQNCYAIPLGTGFDWQAGASGVGPLLPGSAPTLDWANFANADECRHQRHAQRLQPIQHRRLQRRHPVHGRRDHCRSEADEQHLVLRLRLLWNAAIADRHQRRRPSAHLGSSNLQSLLPHGRTAKPARRLSHGYRETRCGLSLFVGSALSARPEHRAARGLGDAGLFLPHQGQELQHGGSAPQQPEQVRGVRCSGLDDPGECSLRHNSGNRHLDQAGQRALPQSVLRPAGIHVQLA